jgi:DNA repair exonuclease SbcCD nuclease subunit
MEDFIKLLCASDLHLGRAIRLPEDFSQDVSIARAFEELVSFAIVNKVDALLLAGDLVDSDEDFFEACNVLEKQIAILKEAKIPIIAVIGNHDSFVYKKISKIVDSDDFYVIGKDEKWESKKFYFKDRVIRIDGFSFNKSVLHYDPFEKYNLLPCEEGEVAIGLLHGDMQSKKSDYAPINMFDFSGKPQSAWVLGHVHQEEILQDHPWIFYCGSLVGMDISEPNDHGAFLLTIAPSGAIACDMAFKSRLRWQEKVILMDGIVEEDFETALYKAATEGINQEGITGLKLILQGRCSFYDKLSVMLASFVFKSDTCFVERVVNLAEPILDLEAISNANDVAAILAKKLLALKSGDDSMIEKMKNELFNLKNGHQYFKVHTLKELTIEEIKAMMLEAGYFVLNEMINNKADVT